MTNPTCALSWTSLPYLHNSSDLAGKSSAVHTLVAHAALQNVSSWGNRTAGRWLARPCPKRKHDYCAFHVQRQEAA